jgi:transcriptional regulator with XRE-family HTH domain
MNKDKPVSLLVEELGQRLAAYRLSRNLRQDDIAERAGVSRGVLVRLEKGAGGTIDSLVRVMKALGIEERLGLLAPDARLNPLDPKSVSGRRQRARPRDEEESDAAPWTWGDE